MKVNLSLVKRILISPAAFYQRFSGETREILQASIQSVAAALTAVAFLLGVNLVNAWTFQAFTGFPLPWFLLASFVTVLSTSLVSGFLLFRLAPAAAGSGIPQLKAAYWKEMGFVPIKPVLIKFVAGILSIGGGASLGREGPTVYMGGGVASNLSAFLGSAKRERRGSSLIGASAGLAAAFNTPLAAVAFVLEEIVGDLSSRHIGKVVLSSVIGAFVVHAVIGRQPAFQLPSIDEVSWLHYLVVPLVALAASLIGRYFQDWTLHLRTRFNRQGRIPRWLLPAVGGMTTWLIGASIYTATGKVGIFGLGYQDLSSILNNDFVWWVAGIMVVGKLAATIASYATGGCGGIFSPLLFIGGATGYFIGGLMSLVLPLSPADRTVLAAIGMSACLGTVVRAPLSAMLIVFEMTHQFSMVPGLLVGMFVSMAVYKLGGKENFYDALLVQDGHELHRIKPPQDLYGWQKQPIKAIASPKPVVATSLEADHLKTLLDDYPYETFPLVTDGKLRGVLRRQDMVAAFATGRIPAIEEVSLCDPEMPIREVAQKIIETRAGVAIVVDKSSGVATGIVTLHDLVRAQAATLD
jgi:CIC family chloride channel protein